MEIIVRNAPYPSHIKPSKRYIAISTSTVTYFQPSTIFLQNLCKKIENELNLQASRLKKYPDPTKRMKYTHH